MIAQFIFLWQLLGGQLLRRSLAKMLIDGRAPADDIAVLGDSLMAQCFNNSVSFNGAVGDSSLSNYGSLFWWKGFSRARLKFKNYAVSGAGSGTLDPDRDVLAFQLGPAIAARHKLYILRVGINDTTLTGAQTRDNILTVYRAVRSIGARLIIFTITPTDAFATTKVRAGIANKGIRDVARDDPATVKYIDGKSFFSDPDSADGNAYGAAFDLTYDTTHDNPIAAIILGKALDQVARPWVLPSMGGPHSNGDAENLFVNAALGGIGGTKPTGGVGQLADSWIAARSAASVAASKYYKVNNVPTVLEVGATPVLGTRCKVLGNRDFHYIVIEVGTAVVTLPSSTTPFDDTYEPDGASGVKYLVLPANDRDKNSHWYGKPFVAQYIECSDTTLANTSISLLQTVTTGFVAGDRVQFAFELEFLDCAWYGFAGRVQATTSGAVKTQDSHGPSYQIPNTLKVEPNLSIRCETPHDYVVPANTANLAGRAYIYNKAPTGVTRCLIHHPEMINLGPPPAP